MKVYNDEVRVKTRGNGHMLDITRELSDAVSRSEVNEGLLNVFVGGATGGITTIEFESGLVQDFERTMESIAPQNDEYMHNLKWGDGNGHSHIRAALINPSLTIPISNGALGLGTWQQVVFIDFDNRERKRVLMVKVLGI